MTYLRKFFLEVARSLTKDVDGYPCRLTQLFHTQKHISYLYVSFAKFTLLFYVYSALLAFSAIL